MNLKEWLSLSQAVFLGQLESCDGPTLSVTEVWRGDVSETWRYSDDDTYWPSKECGVGRQYLVVSYQSEPAILPYYSSSMFPIRRDKMDLRDAIDDSEIDVHGEALQDLEELRQLFLSDAEL